MIIGVLPYFLELFSTLIENKKQKKNPKNLSPVGHGFLHAFSFQEYVSS